MSEVNLAWAEEFSGRWEQAWASHDPERVLGLMTEDIVYDDSAWPTTMRGHADVRRFLEVAWRAMPDLEFFLTEGPYLPRGASSAAFYWRGTGTFTGPLDPPGFAPTGKSLEFHGADFHEYRDGKVSRLRIVFDNMDVGRQLGLLPASGSAAEKAGAAAQRLGVRARGLRNRG